jgi:hypothetical protein
MTYMQLPQKFSAEGSTELAPMSTTTNVRVAISYAIKKANRSALLFRFVVRNNLERGADVQCAGGCSPYTGTRARFTVPCSSTVFSHFPNIHFNIFPVYVCHCVS